MAATSNVRVIADPAETLDRPEIEVERGSGLASMRFAQRPDSGNPRPFALTAASLAASVRRLVDPVVL